MTGLARLPSSIAAAATPEKCYKRKTATMATYCETCIPAKVGASVVTES